MSSRSTKTRRNVSHKSNASKTAQISSKMDEEGLENQICLVQTGSSLDLVVAHNITGDSEEIYKRRQ